MNTTQIRDAIGAGRWFTASKEKLTKEVDDYINDAKAKLPAIDGHIVGCISPHAGFLYSGPTAGYNFAAIQRDAEQHGKPDVVFIIGFSHSRSFNHAAIMDGKAIRTPIGVTEIDLEAIKVFKEGRSYLKCDYNPHFGEHSAENQIPFVQRALPGVKVVVVLVGCHKGDVLKQVAEGLEDVAKSKQIVVVSSSDMLHDENHDKVQRVDANTCELIDKMDYAGLLKEWSYEHQVLCGITAVVPTMMYAESVGCKKAVTLYMTNSELVTNKRHSGWVVGYCASVFVQ